MSSFTEDTNLPEIEQPLLAPIEVQPTQSKWGRLQSSQLDGSFWRKYIVMTIKEIPKKKGNFILGFLSCLLVVMVVCILMSTIANAPVAFLKIGELEAGEMDMIVDVPDDSPTTAFNFTQILQIVSSTEKFQYTTPRIIQPSLVYALNRCLPTIDPNNLDWKYLKGITSNKTCDTDVDPCFLEGCSDDNSFRGDLFLVDSERELKMELGREWIQSGITAPAAGTAHIASSLATNLGVSSGDTIILSLNATSILQGLWQVTTDGSPDSNYQRIYLPIKVASTFPASGYGKYGSKFQLSLFMEYSSFLDLISKNLNPRISSQSKTHIQKSNLYDYAQQLIWNLPPSQRLNAYIDYDYDSIVSNIVGFFQPLVYMVGFPIVSPSIPIVSALQVTRFVSLFLGLALDTVIFILLLLAITLIYSLLSISVEEKTFEMGVLRSLGITNFRMTYILCLQAFAFAIPAWVLGLILSQLFMLIVVAVFKLLTAVELSPLLSARSVLTATALIIIVPLVSSILPIQNVLSKSLYDALERRRSKTHAYQIQLERTEFNSISWPVVLTGVACTFFGFFIYYVFPLSLLAEDLTLLLAVLVFLLIGMICGLVVLSMNVAYLVERALISILLWWESDTITSLTKKNLIAHRVQNQKTSLMYALSLGFIIFLAISQSLSSQTAVYRQRRGGGAYLVAYGKDGNPLEKETVAALQSLPSKNPVILDTTCISESLSSVIDPTNLYTSASISNIGRANFRSPNIFAISPNYFDATFSDFLEFSSYDTAVSAFDLGASLYTFQKESPGIILSTSVAEKIGVQDHSYALLQVKIPQKSFLGFSGLRNDMHRMNPIAILDSAPRFQMSKFPTGSQDALVSYNTFVGLTGGILQSVDEVPIAACVFKTKSDATNDEIDGVSTQIATVIANNDDHHAGIWDLRDATSKQQIADTITAYFFIFAIFVAMIICFFSLMSSMYTNITSQIKEIGVLRILGISQLAIYKMYIYEAAILILSSSLLGLGIGSTVGYTMRISRQLFLQLPIPVYFPWPLVLSIFVFSMIFGFLSSFQPTRKLLKTPSLVELLR